MNKIALISCLCCLSIVYQTLGQQSFSVLTEELDWYYEIDEKKIKQFSRQVSRYKRLYVDSLNIDSTGLYFNQLIFSSNQELLYGLQSIDKKNQCYSIKNDNSIHHVFEIQNNVVYPSFLPGMHVYSIGEKKNTETIWADKLYRINLYNGIETEWVDLKMLTGGSEISDFILSPDDQKILFQSGNTASGVWDTDAFIVYDIKNKKVSQIFDEFRQVHAGGWYSLPSITNSMYGIDGKHTFIEFNQSVNKENDILILDENFVVVGNALPRNYSICGYNYVGGEIVSYNVRSILDNTQRVIIPYSLTYTLEKALYAVYHGQELPLSLYESEYRQLDTRQLSILKNMIFAKHNYGFDSPFYQAFFNLFDFYSSEEKRSTRSREVNSRLSYTDYQNLEKINQAIRRAASSR